MNQDKKNILFIINPIAGVRSKKNIPELLDKYLDSNLFDYKIQYTDSVGHGIQLAENAALSGYEVVVAVGGDGTINEVAKGLLNKQTALGLVPMGSGNGLARHLGVPLQLKKAIQALNSATTKPIDVGFINQELFLCTSGVGFDAEIAHEFDTVEGRGLITYAKCVLSKFSSYKEKEFTLKFGDQVITRSAFSITFANASQYGNGIFISPKSDIADGLLDACILKPIPWWMMPAVWVRMRTKTIEASRLYERYSSTSFELERKEAEMAHLDGEPKKMPEKITVKVLASGLNVFI